MLAGSYQGNAKPRPMLSAWARFRVYVQCNGMPATARIKYCGVERGVSHIHDQALGGKI